MSKCCDFECCTKDPESKTCIDCERKEHCECVCVGDKDCYKCTHYDPNNDECEFNNYYCHPMKPVLDATCGSRMIWFNKNNDLAVFCDQRELDDEAIWTSGDGLATRKCSIHPDVLASFTNLPFDDNSFYHVVFDPPHLTQGGDNAWMVKKYGRLEKDSWQQTLRDGFNECMRVLKPHGTLVFKWNECQIPTKEVIKAIGHEPLYGNRSGKASKTHWMVFIKENGV